MDAVSSVTKEMFRRYFLAALVSIGIPNSKGNGFCDENSTMRLQDMYICTVISMKIDDFMEAIIPDYKGCMPNNTWKDIVDYNFSDD